MRDRLDSQFINLFPRNPTQTRYRRAIKTVTGPMTDEFTRTQAELRRRFRSLEMDKEKFKW